MIRARAIITLAAFLIVPASASPQTTPTLAQQRVAAAVDALRFVQAAYRTGQASIADVASWYARVYAAKRDAGATGAALVAAAQEWADGMRALERQVAGRVATGAASAFDGRQATYFRLEAEMELARVQSGR